MAKADATRARQLAATDSPFTIEVRFGNELTTGFVGRSGNSLSRLTAASLQDLGYEVDLAAADAFALPNLLSLARAGRLVAHVAPVNRRYMIPTVPIPVTVT